MLCAGMVAGCMGDRCGGDFERNAGASPKVATAGSGQKINRLSISGPGFLPVLSIRKSGWFWLARVLHLKVPIS